MNIELDRDFEEQVKNEAARELETKLVGEQDPLVFQAIQQAHDILREFEDQYPGVEAIIESLETPTVERLGGAVGVTFGWTHEAAPYFEYGTSRHTIDGQPVLSFVWEDPPEFVREKFDPEGDGYRVFFQNVEVEGIAETRFVRDALRWLRRRLEV